MLKSDSSDHAERELLIGMNGWIMRLAPLTLTQAGSSPKKQTEQVWARGSAGLPFCGIWYEAHQQFVVLSPHSSFLLGLEAPPDLPPFGFIQTGRRPDACVTEDPQKQHVFAESCNMFLLLRVSGNVSHSKRSN